MTEWRCEDNENSGKKSCSHLARSALPGGRGSLLHKVLYGEVSPLGPTSACVAIVSCGLVGKEGGTRVKNLAKNGSPFISRAAKTENPVPRSSILAQYFARSLTLVPRSLLLNGTAETPLFAWSLTLVRVPRSLFLNRTETLATQAWRISKLEDQFLYAQKPTSSRHYKTFLVKMYCLPSPFNPSIRPALGVRGEEILDDGAGEGNRDSIEKERQFLSFRSLPFRFSLHFSQKHLILRLQSFPPTKKATTESR